VRRTRRAELLDEVVVATTDKPKDAPLVQWCKDRGVPVFRGSETDVLDRFYRCAKAAGASHAVRLTGDCPLLDWRLVDEVTKLSLDDDGIDYASNCEPMTYPEGMSVEAMPMRVVECCWREAVLPSHREHVTPFVRFHADRFRHGCLRAQPDLSHLRLTVDYPEDMRAIDDLMSDLHARGILDAAGLTEIVRCLDERPDLIAILGTKQRDLWRREVARDERRAA
jgi:spore coat polysaccharide biosynthesis protein SpsF (cytidylyltransferase family)